MAHSSKAWFLLLIGLSPALLADYLPPRDYTAVYQLLRNDKEVGEVTISLSHQGEVWTLHGFTHNMRGLAKMLKIKGSQTSTGKWTDGRFLPHDYTVSFSLIGYKTGWNADFDWTTDVVTTTSKDTETRLSLLGGAVDPFSLSLSIRSLLAENQSQMKLAVIDEDVIDSEVYAAQADEFFDSALGCLQTTKVKRIRENNKRSSMIWYANDHDFVPVLMHHSKRKGNKLELQITSLAINGKKITPVTACADNPDA